MSLLSVLIPSRNEKYLLHTVEDIFNKATGPIEVIVTLDGYWPEGWGDFANRYVGRLHTIHRGEARGMRDGINSAAAIAKGEYLMKSDAHCMFAEGFDETLKADCDDDWVVVPRRHRLDAEHWKLQDVGKPPIDYHYLSWPYAKPEEIGMHGAIWVERQRAREHILIDSEMSSQGSCWFMRKRHFDRLGGLSEVGYGRFVQEFQEIGNKTWLSGGQVKVNKKTWYAHLHKGKAMGRGYYISKGEMVKGTHWSADYWMNNRWPERKYDLEWLIEKFWPVPTWPENWKELTSQYSLGSDGLTICHQAITT